MELRARGHAINHKRVAKVMTRNGLHVKRRRSFKPTSGAEADLATFPNLYRNIIPTAPDRACVADITYIRTRPASSILR
ncbi:IS3 family transposase [Collimonas sp. OK242]|uniref:IS3 family transposase n=1 Tax=Collimonas sp. OK242 TaxID=1798195 RepID=UPI000B89558B